MVPPSLPDDERVAALRAQLPALGAGIYLNAGLAGPLPAETQAAMDQVAQRELAIGRAHADIWPETEQRLHEARAVVAAALVADPGEVALTHGTTDGLNLALAALPLRAGDRLATTRHEHPGGLGAALALRDRAGVELDLVDVGDGGDGDAVVAAFAGALERGARAVLLSHVLWDTGAVLPVARIAALARAAGAWVVVDGAQAAGALPVDATALDADAYALPAQKWLLGPEGMGALRVGPRFLAAARPPAQGWLSYAAFAPDGTVRLHADARRFEATGFHRPSVVGFARSVGWLTMFVGLPWALARAAVQAVAAAERLAAIPGVVLVTPRTALGTLVTFRIAGWPADEALDELGRRTFAIARTIPGLDAIRVSVGWWTTDAELDRFAEGVALLARHTPATLPPRRILPVLGGEVPG